MTGVWEYETGRCEEMDGLHWGWIGLGVVIFGALVLVFYQMKKIQDAHEARVNQRFEGQEILRIDKAVTLIAQKSHGLSQTQGLGWLVLTHRELYFDLRLMNRIVSLSPAEIIRVGETNRIKAKSTLRTMLHIEFKKPGEEEDGLGLLVKDLKGWKSAISDFMKSP